MNSARSTQRKFGRSGARRCRTLSWWRGIRMSASNRFRDLKQSHSMRTNRRPIAIIRRSWGDSLLTASEMDGVFGSGNHCLGLLRTRRQRPRRHTAEERHELPPPQ